MALAGEAVKVVSLAARLEIATSAAARLPRNDKKRSETSLKNKNGTALSRAAALSAPLLEGGGAKRRGELQHKKTNNLAILLFVVTPPPGFAGSPLGEAMSST